MTDNAEVEIGAADTILIVDNDVLVRLVISDYLRTCGYRVVEASNADEALLVLQKAEITIDVVFTDVEMPGSMDGFGLSQWTREHKPDVAICLVGSPSRAATAAAELCLSGPHLAKPYEPETLREHITRLLAERAGRLVPEC